jgi:hypothetical protein
MQQTVRNTAPEGGFHEVTATFPTSESMQEAMKRLSLAGFDRADLSLPDKDVPAERATPEAGAQTPDTPDDAQQARVVHTSTAASAAAIAAAGLTVASGGAALPVIAATVLAGAAVGGATFTVSTWANSSTQADRDRKAASGTLVLSARAPTREKQAEAEAILRAAGGTDIQVS